jgi:4-carboxymuconolactone decarboxylase
VTAPFKGTGGARLGGSTVTFEPGARTNWHIHPLGQLLIITAGHGWVQAEGGPMRTVGAGDVVWTPPGVKHCTARLAPAR